MGRESQDRIGGSEDEQPSAKGVGDRLSNPRWQALGGAPIALSLVVWGAIIRSLARRRGGRPERVGCAS